MKVTGVDLKSVSYSTLGAWVRSGADYFVQGGRRDFSQKKNGERGSRKNHPENVDLFEQGAKGRGGKEQVGPVPVDMQGKADGHGAEQADKGAEDAVNPPRSTPLRIILSTVDSRLSVCCRLSA